MILSKPFAIIGAVAAFGMATSLFSQTAGFTPSVIGDNGILNVRAMDTYYDNANGTMFTAVPLPAGATHLQFRVTGGVITDGTDKLASADGLYANGQTPYNWTATDWDGAFGTYHGTSIGATTGIDPALFGIFFNSIYLNTPPSSSNFRSDSGVLPDPRTLLWYFPAVNQPFYIGDGYSSNNAYVTNVDSYLPLGTNQTFAIPSGATYLLLGIGADPNMSDNQNPADTNSAFTVHVFDDSAAAPQIAAVTSSGPVLYQRETCVFSVLLAAGASPLSYQWSLNGVNLTDNAGISGANSNVLSLAAVQSTDAGVYQVLVTNLFGQASNHVTLAVNASVGTVTYTNLNIPANAEIHGAGNAGLPDASGGVNPVLVNLPANAILLTLSNVTGIISLNGGSGHNDADGVTVSGSGYPGSSFAGAYGGISGISIPGAGALVGVFEPATAPSGSAPATLDFTVTGTGFTNLAPALYQTFFIGDGLTGDGTGAVQQFLVPAGATRLFLGVPDAGGFNGSPGGYSDNSGAFTASLQVLVPGPQLTGPQLSGTNFSFTFPTVVGQSYTVQQTTNLIGAAWNLYNNFIGDGSRYQLIVPVAANRASFFRVREP